MITLEFTADLLTASDEKELAHAIAVGAIAADALTSCGSDAARADLHHLAEAGRRAFDRFAEANLKLVMMVVGPEVRRTGLPYDELFQEGVLGLCEAIRRYDHRRQARFATFGLPWVRMRVGTAVLTRCGALGLTPGRSRAWWQVRAAWCELVNRNGRQPSVTDLMHELGRSREWIEAHLAWQSPAPLDADVAWHNDQAEEVDSRREAASEVAHLLQQLRGDDRRVVELRYGLGGGPCLTQQAVAVELGISESTVRRRERSALAVLRRRTEATMAA